MFFMTLCLFLIFDKKKINPDYRICGNSFFDLRMIWFYLVSNMNYNVESY